MVFIAFSGLKRISVNLKVEVNLRFVLGRWNGAQYHLTSETIYIPLCLIWLKREFDVDWME